MSINYEAVEWRIRGQDIKIQKRLDVRDPVNGYVILNSRYQILTKGNNWINVVIPGTSSHINSTRFRTFDDALKHVEKYLKGQIK